MKEIFRDPDSAKVSLCQSIVESAGIRTHLRNEFLSAAEVVIPVFYPALCVVDPDDYQRAVDVLKEHFEADQERAQLPDIACPECSEENPATFDICWSCEAALVEEVT